MIPGDIGVELDRTLQAMRHTAAEQPHQTALVPGAAGTWRPAPTADGGGPGTYATSLPILLGRQVGRDPERLAAELAQGLAEVPWVAAARVTGPGYLTVTVTTRHLRGLPVRIIAADRASGPITAPLPDPASAPDWERAWYRQRDALLIRIAQAVGSDDPDINSEHPYGPGRQPPPDSAPRSRTGPVAEAVAWHGSDAVRYVLARTPGPRRAAIERQLGLPADLDNPFAVVRYAHAHAASTARWAAELTGAADQEGGPEEAAADPQPAELALLDLLSWRDERLAAASRRRRPGELCAYAEQVAAAYLECAYTCPALACGGAAAPRDPAGPLAAARLELAGAARAVVGDALKLTGLSLPVRVFGI